MNSLVSSPVEKNEITLFNLIFFVVINIIAIFVVVINLNIKVMKILSYTLAIVTCDNNSISEEGIKTLCSNFENKENMDIVICNADKEGIAFRGLFPGTIQLCAYVEPKDYNLLTGFSKVLVKEKVCAPGIVLFNCNTSKDYTIDKRSEEKIIEKYKIILESSIKFIEKL